MARTLHALALAVCAAALAACPAPPLDDPGDFDVTPWDAVPGDLALGTAPSCAPESVVDVNARGRRSGHRIELDVDTRTGRNDLHPRCVTSDSTEVVLRYTAPGEFTADAGGGAVQAIRVSTITAVTIANGATGGDTGMASAPDPTSFDTVLALYGSCDARDYDCNNDALFLGPTGQGTRTRRSEVWQTGLSPEDVVLIAVDGYDGSQGSAHVTIDEFTELGVEGAPCLPIPPQRAHDPTAATAAFRCPHPGVRCQPEASSDGQDLCVPIVPLGGVCDQTHHFDVCDPALPDAQCAQNPSDQAQVQCALPGTAPGTTCRSARGAADRCDDGLYCSESGNDRDPDYCVPIRRAGESCDPTPNGAINHCADGYQCCATTPDGGMDTSCVPVGGPCYVPSM